VGKTMSFTITGTEIPNDAATKCGCGTALPAERVCRGTNVGSATGTFQWDADEAGSPWSASMRATRMHQPDRCYRTAYDVGAGGAAYGGLVGLNKYSSVQ
jgi:hypothetical protein